MPVKAKPSKLMFEILAGVFACIKTRSLGEVPLFNKSSNEVLSAAEALVPKTFFNKFETISSFVVRCAAFNTILARSELLVPPSNKCKQNPTYCLLLK